MAITFKQALSLVLVILLVIAAFLYGWKDAYQKGRQSRDAEVKAKDDQLKCQSQEIEYLTDIIFKDDEQRR